MPATLNLPRLRLTRQAKVLLAVAGTLLLIAPLAPLLQRLARPAATELVETGLACEPPYAPAGAALVVVTTDIGAGSTMSRPALSIPGHPGRLYLCSQGAPR